MTDHILIDPETNLVKPAVYPCYKSGLYKCQLRRTDSKNFECCVTVLECRFKTKIKPTDSKPS